MSSAKSAATSHRQLKILLVCLETGGSNEALEKLAAAGHFVMEAVRGDDAARILRNRPVNLVLVQGGQDASALLDVALSLRSESGRVSARYTPIFVLSDNSKPSLSCPNYIDRVLAAPLDSDALVAAYMDFLSVSLNGAKPGGEPAPCCEIDAAVDRLGGDVDLYKDLVDRFLDDRSGTRRRLETAIAHGDLTLLHNAAHSLKGLAASVGAITVAAALAELEELGRAGDLQAVTAVWQRLQIEMERTADELRAYHRPNEVSPAQSH